MQKQTEMNCKNCKTELNSEQSYCHNCGAKVVNERITTKGLISDFLDSLGWDNQFIVTFRDLIIRPQLVFSQYLKGTRKKYTNPFTFFAIGVTLTVLVISFYSDKLIDITAQSSIKPAENIMSSIPEEEGVSANEMQIDYLEKLEVLNKKIMYFQYNYYYYLSFLLLPFFALLAFIVFGKPDNYGEHLIINAYIQGLLFFVTLLLFIVTLLIGSDVHSANSILLTILFYCYSYKRYRSYTLGKILMKLLKFLALLIPIFIVFFIIGLYIGKIMSQT